MRTRTFSLKDIKKSTINQTKMAQKIKRLDFTSGRFSQKINNFLQNLKLRVVMLLEDFCLTFNRYKVAIIC